MRILVHTGTRDCLNLGDVAMLQVAVRRLRALWPAARIEVLTDAPEALRRHCPDTEPVPASGLRPWVAERFLLGNLHQRLPEPVSHGLVGMKRAVRRRWPAALDLAIRARESMRPSGYERIYETVRRADLVVACGQGSLTDAAPAEAAELLALFELAAAKHKPAAAFSQGIGPCRTAALMARMAAVLPSARLIAVREGANGPVLLRSAGVRPGRVAVTGDDAVELGWENRASAGGDAIGLNLRVSPNAGTKDGLPDRMRPLVRKLAEKAPVVPLPVSIHKEGTNDAAVLGDLLHCASDGVDTPAKLARRIAGCRLVVTGAYHAAVLALAQGIPAVCLAQSDFFRDKFEGIAAEFGAGCEVLSGVDSLEAAVGRLWNAAGHLRAPLLSAAERQVEAARAAYMKFGDMVA